jgi:hypothetical protein
MNGWLRGLFGKANLRGRWGLAAFALAVGFWTLASTARVTKSAALHSAPVPIAHRAAPQRVVLMFIDSLARDIAIDARRMPVLARLASEGASFEVEPCRDQLTYLCLRATLTGRDDSSLLAISDNFRPSHEGPAETLLSALAAQQRGVVVVGSPDFHPYRRWLSSEHDIGKRDETPERILKEYRAVASSGAQLVIFSLTSGDMTAHAHGVGSPQYYEAFTRLDSAVGAIAGALEPGTSLVVFGDHGHDAQGRHLPGTASKTWAVYHGPAFRAGAKAAMRITDHRALLGVLLGVPTEAIYQGPALASLLEPAWVANALGGSVPELQAPASPPPTATTLRWSSALGLLLCTIAASWLALAGQRRRGPLVALAGLAAVLALAVGVGFDVIRTLVHDHGGDGWRGICLLVPLLLGCGVAWLLRRGSPFADASGASSWLQRASAATVLVTLLLMLPTAYYYGSRRAIVLAGVAALVFMLLDYLRRPVAARERWLPILALLLSAGVLVSFYQVKQLGPETGGAASWALDAAVYTRANWLPLILAKLVLFALLIAPRAAAHPVDTAIAAALLLTCLAVELGGLRLPRVAYAAAFATLLVGVVGGAWRAPGSLLAAALLLLDHLYGVSRAQIAPIEALLATTALSLLAWQRMRLSEPALRWASGLTVAVAFYLMFWPTVGFHLVGIDFAFMFEWIPAENYEKSWLLIALGVIVKLALPLVLVIAVAAPRLRDPRAALVVLSTLAAKVALLSLMIASYALWHDLTSQVALAMLAELALLMFGVCSCVAAMPSRQHSAGAPSSEPLSSSPSMPTSR